MTSLCSEAFVLFHTCAWTHAVLKIKHEESIKFASHFIHLRSVLSLMKSRALTLAFLYFCVFVKGKKELSAVMISYIGRVLGLVIEVNTTKFKAFYFSLLSLLLCNINAEHRVAT